MGTNFVNRSLFDDNVHHQKRAIRFVFHRMGRAFGAIMHLPGMKDFFFSIEKASRLALKDIADFRPITMNVVANRTTRIEGGLQNLIGSIRVHPAFRIAFSTLHMGDGLFFNAVKINHKRNLLSIFLHPFEEAFGRFLGSALFMPRDRQFGVNDAKFGPLRG